MINLLSGTVLMLAIAMVVLAEWVGEPAFYAAASGGVVAFLALVALSVPWSRKVFLLAGLGFLSVAMATRPDWLELAERGLRSAAFVIAFFLALIWLRIAASSSPTIERCGRFLAEQPPGRRYLALTIGAHLYGLVLSYGSISLLGSLAERGARAEPDLDVRATRMRRMLLAIHRGFVTTTCWSPMTYSIAISTSVIPGATWSGAVGWCAVNAIVLAGLGWGLDAVLKPRLSAPPPSRPASGGSWMDLKPLLILLALIMGSAGLVHWATGIRAVAVLMVVVPALSIGWIGLQNRNSKGGPVANMGRRALQYAVADAPDHKSDLVLLAMAAFIGTLGSSLIAPLLTAAGIDLSAVPAWIILVALVWLLPITGQLGMNPIMSVYLIAPLVPDAEAIGVAPSAIIVALTAGWALASVSSPFTATILLVSALGRVSPLHVGWVWNGPYMALGLILLSSWVAIVAGI